MDKKSQDRSLDVLIQGRKKPKKYLSKGQTIGVVAGSFAAGVLLSGLAVFTIGYKAGKK